MRFPPENGLRSASATARSAPESQSKTSPDAFFAPSTEKIPKTMTRTQGQERGPSTAASVVPRSIDAAEASVIFGSATRQTPHQNRGSKAGRSRFVQG